MGHLVVKFDVLTVVVLSSAQGQTCGHSGIGLSMPATVTASPSRTSQAVMVAKAVEKQVDL